MAAFFKDDRAKVKKYYDCDEDIQFVEKTKKKERKKELVLQMYLTECLVFVTKQKIFYLFTTLNMPLNLC